MADTMQELDHLQEMIDILRSDAAFRRMTASSTEQMVHLTHERDMPILTAVLIGVAGTHRHLAQLLEEAAAVIEAELASQVKRFVDVIEEARVNDDP